MVTASDEGVAMSDLAEPSPWASLTQQRPLMIGAGLAGLALLFLWLRRSDPRDQAARRLVRDWGDVDDVDDARAVVGSNLPTILQPVLLILLREVEAQVDRGFRELERRISRL
jgi:hypothetical protein